MATSEFDFTEILRSGGFRATPGRIALLSLLAKQRQPLTVAEIAKKLGRKGMNEVTLYRALEALAKKGIVERTELGHGHAHWELAAGKRHHHHVVCTDCGKVEDLIDSRVETAIEKAARTLYSFKKINNHSIELFGLCARCA